MTRSWVRLAKSKRVWASVIVLLGAILFTYRASHKPASGSVGKVQRADLVQRVTIAGTVIPNRKTVLSAPYNGYVRKVFVKVGDTVRAGDPIVSVAQSLRGGGDDVYPLRAPFAGVVVQVLRTEGEYVEQNNSQGGGNALVRIDDLSRLFVEANAPEVEIEKLKIGQDAVIKASAVLGDSFQGKIESISLAAKEQRDWDKSRVEFPVTLRVLDSPVKPKPGMSVVADITIRKLSQVLTLAHEYIQKEGERYFVTTESGQKKAIQVGQQNEEVFEICSGLSDGERVRQTDFMSLIQEK